MSNLRRLLSNPHAPEVLHVQRRTCEGTTVQTRATLAMSLKMTAAIRMTTQTESSACVPTNTASKDGALQQTRPWYLSWSLAGRGLLRPYPCCVSDTLVRRGGAFPKAKVLCCCGHSTLFDEEPLPDEARVKRFFGTLSKKRKDAMQTSTGMP